MGFTPYQQFGFNPAMPSVPYYPSSLPQSAPQNPSLQTNVNWAYVNGFEGARAQIVQPGQTSWMMDNNDSIIYVKAVDVTGTATLKAFRLTEISGSCSASTNTDPSNFITRDEFDSIRKRIEEIETTFGGTNT